MPDDRCSVRSDSFWVACREAFPLTPVDIRRLCSSRHRLLQKLTQPREGSLLRRLLVRLADAERCKALPFARSVLLGHTHQTVDGRVLPKVAISSYAASHSMPSVGFSDLTEFRTVSSPPSKLCSRMNLYTSR